MIVPVVGIGTSTGGLEAVRSLLANLPATTGLAFVFVQHLESNHDNNLTEILAGVSAMPVQQATDGLGVEPDHIYVIPPDAGWEIAERTLRTMPRGPMLSHMPIDRFLRSLAQECGSRAIGVILSGAGTDGAAGLEAVKAAGGVTFAQDPKTPKCGDIPHVAIGSGYVDAVFSPEAIAAELTKLGRHLSHLSHLHRDPFTATARFFGGSKYFEGLKNLVFPRVVQGRPAGAAIRIWVPDCASGEEVYSTAISLEEFLQETGRVYPIQIFATDISAAAVEGARRGRYPESTAADVGPERLNRFFSKVGEGYQVTQALREMCVFSRHDLIQDPPFSRLDLISCRNPMSLSGGMRETVFRLFHYALNPGGFLLLGPAQRGPGDLFSTVEAAHGIHAKNDTAGKAHRLSSGAASPCLANTREAERIPAGALADGIDLQEEMERRLLSRYRGFGLIVDKSLAVLETIGQAPSYLTLPSGARFNLWNVVPETMFAEVEKLVRDVQQGDEAARKDRVSYGAGVAAGDVNIEVIPLDGSPTRAFLILFEPRAIGSDTKEASGADHRDREITILKRDLADTRERFLPIIEANRSSWEENQSVVEEAISANEELRSLNEELETAKEQLESTNLKLVTVNEELRSTNAALTEARDFAVSIIETTTAPLLVLDRDLRIKTANQSFYRAFLISPRETEGQLLFSISNGCWNTSRLREVMESLLAHKAVRSFEIEQDFPLIGHRVLVLSARQLDGSQQILLGVEDVTERKQRAEATLQESEARFRNMADTAPVNVWVAGPNKGRTFVNKCWLTFTGRTMQQELGDGWVESVHPEDTDRCLNTYSSAFDAGRSFQMEYRMRRADGEYRWLADNGTPRFEPGGVFVGYVGSCVDITDLKRIHEEHLAKQKLQSLGTLAGGIAHDFNNLLGGVLANSEVALAELASGSRPEKELQRIRSVAIRGAEIVRQLMIYAGEENAVVELAGVSEIVEDILELLNVSVSKHTVVETDLSKNLPPVRVNPGQLQQVVMNLITNASDAIGDRDGVIRVTTRRVTVGPNSPAPEHLDQGDYVQLEVSDTGRGMTAETQVRVFDPFFTTKESGHGLGLAVVQGIVRSLKGAIHLVSAPGTGTIFQILLPCVECPVQPLPPPDQRDGQGTLRNKAATILFVEDEKLLREAASKMFRKKGFSVIEACDGTAALDLIQTHRDRIDVLLLDITLPGVSSRVVFEEARRLRPGLPVIVTSANSENMATEVLANRVERFIRKPYSLRNVMDIILESLPS